MRYAIYHASFREVIEGELPSASGAEQSDYVIALADELQQSTMEAHRRIAQTYLADFGGLGAGLPILATNSSVADEDGSYPLRQLARHLQHAQRAADLHRLLAVEHPVSGDGAVNVWFAAKDQADSVMSYLDDLARADGDALVHGRACETVECQRAGCRTFAPRRAVPDLNDLLLLLDTNRHALGR